MRAREHEVLLDDDVGVSEHAVGRRSIARLPIEDVIVGLSRLVVADQRRVGIERPARIDDGRQQFVVDVDQLERVARRVSVVGHHERDLLALEAHLVGGEHGLRVGRDRLHPGDAAVLEIPAGDDRVHLRVLERRGRVDRDDPGMRDRASQDGAVEHPRQLHVIDEVALAANEARVLLAPHAAEADRVPVGIAHVRARCSAAQRTERTIVA